MLRRLIFLTASFLILFKKRGIDMNSEAISMILVFVGVLLFVIGFIALIIKAIRKKKKLPALLVMLVSVVMIISSIFVFAGEEISNLVPESSESIMEEAKDYAETLVIAEYNPVTHSNIKSVDVKFTSDDVDGNEYTLYGKVTVMDQYNDSYRGNFSVVLSYNEASDSFTKKSVDIETPTKK